MQQAWLVLVEQPLDRALADGVAMLALGRQVEQQHVDARIGQLAGNAEPHRARADDGCIIDFVHRSMPGCAQK